ncbi:MAG: ABC transporter, permease protein (cluster 3, basic aa/glutamine/opines) [Ktedonobacterales bacterium]|jgi:His/Glu/Gln/Arg/opine family amino acid ABC transporter permease subunit|nr:MAG: ABC transporter, permease protein (cluster 3, basic aa/glutamine/opines) [Ktedonobacterales bacterium]
MDVIFNNLSGAAPALLAGTITTIVAALLAGILAMLFGIPAGFGRLSRVPLIRSISTFYVETIRGTPLLLQLFVWFYAVKILLLTIFNLNVDTFAYSLLTDINSNSIFPRDTGISPYFFAIFGLGFNYGAYIAEVIRGGIEAVEHGQIEAAQTLGLGSFQIARLIILPQALRIMIPPLTNNFITLVQDTAFLEVLGIAELSLVALQKAQAVGSNVTLRWSFYITDLLIYFVICYSLALISRHMERRVAVTVSGAH